jgi:hypothetical protein
MDEVIKAIDEARNIKPSSLRIYRLNLGKAFRTIVGDGKFNLDFLKDKEAVLKFVEPMKDATKRTYLSSFLVALDSTGGSKDLIEYYRERMFDTQKKVEKTYENGKLSDKQKNNWVSFNVLKNITKTLHRELKEDDTFSREKLTKKQRQDFQDWIIASLYTMGGDDNPPVRLDYANMKVVKKEDYDDIPQSEKEDHNYLVLGKRDMYFVFNDFKTESKYGSKKIKVGPALKSALVKWLPHVEDNHYLLTGHNDLPISTNTLGSAITRIFRRTGKSITASLIRNIYLTERFPRDEIGEKEDIASKMMNSVEVQKNVYRKDTSELE